MILGVTQKYELRVSFKLKEKIDTPKTQFLYKRIINKNLIKAS